MRIFFIDSFILTTTRKKNVLNTTPFEREKSANDNDNDDVFGLENFVQVLFCLFVEVWKF